jgi:hypothetical protein
MTVKKSKSTEVKSVSLVFFAAAIGAVLGIAAYVNNWLG